MLVNMHGGERKVKGQDSVVLRR